MRLWKFLLSSALVACFAVDALAGISVRFRPHGSTSPTAWTSTIPGNITITNNYPNWLSNTEGITIDIATPSGTGHAVDGDWWFRCASPTGDSIGKIRFTGVAGNVNVFVCAPDSSGNGPADFDLTNPLSTAACNNFGEFEPGNATAKIQLNIGGDVKFLGCQVNMAGDCIVLTDPPRIEANHIVRVDVGGSMFRPIVVHNSTSDVLQAVAVQGDIVDDLTVTSDPLANSVAPRIESKGGRINLVRVTGTSKSIQVPVIVRANGEVTKIESVNGDIGGARPPESVPPDYQATKIYAGTIGDVIGKNIRSNITATVGIKHIESTGSEPTGGIRGNIVAPTLLNRTSTTGALIKSAQAFNANVTLDTFPSNAMLTVGTYFGYAGSTGATDANKPIIQINSVAAFAGQIIINSKNIDDWGVAGGGHADIPVPFRGKVKPKISSTTYATITDAAYATLDTDIGGGAVGVVPFQMHGQASSPNPGLSGRYQGVLQTAFTSTIAIPILIKSYGAFKASTGTLGSTVVVEGCDPADPCHWIEVPSLFSVQFSPSVAGNAAPRTIGISTNTLPPPPGVYRLRIKEGKLVCKDIDATSNVVMAWPQFCQVDDSYDLAYVFRIAPNCTLAGDITLSDLYEIDQNPSLDTNQNDSIDACDMTSPCDCDWDGSGAMQVVDIFRFLSDWFAGCTTAQTPPPCYHSADFNHVGGMNVQDIFDFLSCWFANQCR